MIGVTNDTYACSSSDFMWSQPYLFDDLTWCVRRAKQIPAWKRPLYIATISAVAVGMMLLTAAIFIVYAFTSFEDRPCDIWTSAFVILQAVLLVPCKFKPKRRTFRYYFGMGTIGMLATTTIFTSYYFDFIMAPRYLKQVRSFDQLINYDCLLAGDENTKAYLMERNLVNHQRTEIESHIRFLTTCICFFFFVQLTATQKKSFILCANSSHCLAKLDQREDIAVAVSRQNALAMTSTHDVFCFGRANNIRNYSKALLMRQSRLQIQEWNEKIQQAIEGGLVEKWLRDLKNNTKIERNVVIRPFKVQDLYAGFLICSVFLLVAIIAFIFEFIIHHKLRGANPHQFWRTADWIIDGQRHSWKIRANRPRNETKQWQVPVRTYCSRIRYPHLLPPLATTRRPLRRTYWIFLKE